MIILPGIQQGSPEWSAVRAKHDTASEAPIMMGASKYQTRSDLLRQKATGLMPEITSHQQTLFDRGHSTESAALTFVEEMIGESLSPITALSDDGTLLASFDGITLLGDIVYEHKLWSESLATQVSAGELEPHYYWQLEQQLLVSGAEKVIFVISGGAQKFAHMEYRAVPGRREQLIAAWRQFREDLAAASQPEPVKAAPVAAVVEGCGALSLRVEGRVLASNLNAFKAGAEAFIARLPKPADLQTDQDFVNADAAVKACAEAEGRIMAAKGAALAQMADVDAVLRIADSIAEVIRAARLSLDKVVKAEKENRRTELIRAGTESVRAHYVAINATMLPGFEIGVPASLTSDIGCAIKGLKSLGSIRDKIGTVVAQAKIAASQDADRRRLCIAVIEQHAEHRSLLPDAAALVANKSPDDLRNLIVARIAAHEAEQERKLEAERKSEQERARVREEERARSAAEAAQQQSRPALATVPH